MLTTLRRGPTGPLPCDPSQEIPYEYPSFGRPRRGSPARRRAYLSGGIVLPDSAAEKPVQGEILAVGTGKMLDNGERRPLDVKVGDRVLFGKYSGTEVKIAGETYLVIREEDIMGVVEG